MTEIRETVTKPRQEIVGWRCDWCGMETKDKRAWGVKEQGSYSAGSDIREGCEVSAVKGEEWPTDSMGDGRKVDLCFDCATKVLDWMESQGAKIEKYDW